MKKGNAQNVSFKTLCGGQFTLIRRIQGVFLSNKKRAARVISDANNQESSVTLFNSLQRTFHSYYLSTLEQILQMQYH